MLRRVISGGQTGVDQAGLRAARAFAIETGGYMPKGWKTESGSRPDLARAFGLVEHDSPLYPPRTKANVAHSDGTLWLQTDAGSDSSGRACTLGACYAIEKPCIWLTRGSGDDPAKIVDWIRSSGIRVLNVAGNRESKSPGIGEWAERLLCDVFRMLGHVEF